MVRRWTPQPSGWWSLESCRSPTNASDPRPTPTHQTHTSSSPASVQQQATSNNSLPWRFALPPLVDLRELHVVGACRSPSLTEPRDLLLRPRVQMFRGLRTVLKSTTALPTAVRSGMLTSSDGRASRSCVSRHSRLDVSVGACAAGLSTLAISRYNATTRFVCSFSAALTWLCVACVACVALLCSHLSVGGSPHRV
jgi:hypothetical protein